jgi:hypothetical protein
VHSPCTPITCGIPAGKEALQLPEGNGKYGAPGEIRTPDLTLRRRSLHPAELRAHSDIIAYIHKAAADAYCGNEKCSWTIRSTPSWSREKTCVARPCVMCSSIARPPAEDTLVAWN